MAQDYDWHSCATTAPDDGHCSLKRANEAFAFLAFFFTFTGIIIEGWLLRSVALPGNNAAAHNNGFTQKEEIPAGTTATGTNGAAANV